jgi:hypothetical protein
MMRKMPRTPPLGVEVKLWRRRYSSGFPSLAVLRDQTSLRFHELTPMTTNLGMCDGYDTYSVAWQDPLPTKMGAPPIRAATDQRRETRTRFDWVRGWDLLNILPLDLNLILNSQFSTELSTYFIIDQYIEKLRHNSQLRTTRLNNYHALFYSKIDSYLILSL